MIHIKKYKEELKRTRETQETPGQRRAGVLEPWESQECGSVQKPDVRGEQPQDVNKSKGGVYTIRSGQASSAEFKYSKIKDQAGIKCGWDSRNI